MLTSEISPADETVMAEFVRALVEREIMRRRWGVLFAFEFETGHIEMRRLHVSLGKELEVVLTHLPLEFAWLPPMGT